MKIYRSLTDFIERLRREGELADIREPVNPKLVIPEIQRRVVAAKGPALLFHNVAGSPFPVALNLFGSQKRIDLAFGREPAEVIRDLVHVMENMPPKSFKDIWEKKYLLPRMLKVGLKKRKSGPLTRNRLSTLESLPALTCWPEDGGPFVTLPLVHTQHPQTGKSNVGMYRVQIQGPRQAGMHIQIHRGGGNHYFAAEAQNEALPAVVYVGGHPAHTISAVAPLPEDVPELVFASLLMGRKLDMIKNSEAAFPLIADADFCIFGKIPPHKRAPEGPFGDHYGYYSLKHDYPYMEVEGVYHRDQPVWAATVVGRPPQEDHFIALYLQELFSPLFPVVMKGVKDVFAYEESGVHSLAGAIVQERYHRESFTACMRVLGEGQLSLSKVLMATEAELDLKNFGALFRHVIARCDFRTDFHILSNISLDTLDYTGPEINKGSKAIFLGLGPARFPLEAKAPTSFSNARFGAAQVFCPGVLVVKGPAYTGENNDAEQLLAQPEIKGFRMVILHDDPAAACENDQAFLWHVFTRFEPAGDIYGVREIKRNHLAFEAPLVIDCRMKPGYPGVLEVDPETKKAADHLMENVPELSRIKPVV